MAALEAGIPKLAARSARRRGARRGRRDAHHRHRAQGSTSPASAGSAAVVGGMAKGAAMLSPAMATMLAVLTTDAAVEPAALQAALDAGGRRDLRLPERRRLPLTNDTVIVLANGAAGAAPLTDADLDAFTDALTDVCGSLAEQMARDAEGATKLAAHRGRGARTDADARLAARAVANSQLVQCSLNGGDPYWGRVLSELGASGAFLDPEQVDIAYNGVTVCRDGIACPHDEDALARVMAGARHRDRVRPPPGARSRRRCSPPTSSHALHRREPAAPRERLGDRRRSRQRARRPTSSPRRCRTSASSRARPSSSSTAATRWTTPRSPTSSPRTSCSCASSA